MILFPSGQRFVGRVVVSHKYKRTLWRAVRWARAGFGPHPPETFGLKRGGPEGLRGRECSEDPLALGYGEPKGKGAALLSRLVLEVPGRACGSEKGAYTNGTIRVVWLSRGLERYVLLDLGVWGAAS